MSVTTLDSLPVEVLVRICEHLDHEHISSVLAFAITSKFNYSVASSLLLRTIKLYVVSRPQLARDVQEYCHRLQRSTGFRHVRRLIIDGLNPKKAFKNFNNPRFQRRKLKISGQDRGYPETIFGRAEYDEDEDEYEDDGDAVKVDHTSVHEIDKSWKPLADLIPELPALSNLIYRCPSQFPPCLLHALHDHRPQCRIHIDKFYFRSINAPSIDAYELLLASSPCLYSITVMCKYYTLSHRLRQAESPHDFNLETSMNMVSGLAPNLKEIRWLFEKSRVGRSSPNFRKELPSGTEPKNFSRGFLRSLGHSGVRSITKLTVEQWMTHIDFSVIQVLNFEHRADQDALALLSNECKFPSLKALLIHCSSNDSEFPPITYQFLRSLPPLSKLVLVEDGLTNLVSGGPRVNLDSFIDHHGETLMELQLPISLFHPLSEANVELLRDSCPLLEDLKITLKRTRGDCAEVRTYKTLGSLPRLKNLLITLDASHKIVDIGAPGDLMSPNDPSFDEFEQEYFDGTFFHTFQSRPRNGHIRDAFINSALDETLAREIFHTISSGKRPGSLPLQKLKLEVIGGGHFGSGAVVIAIAEVVRNLSRSWVIRRNPRDDRPGEPLATDIYEKRRTGMRWRPLDNAIKPIFRRIWPVEGEGAGWWDDWHSLPLSSHT